MYTSHMKMATCQPRERTQEQKAKLEQAEQDVRKAKAELEYWLNEVKRVLVGGLKGEKNAPEEQAIFIAERDKAQMQFDKLKAEAELEYRLNEATYWTNEVKNWSSEVKKAPIGSKEEKKALEQQALFIAQREKAQMQLDKLQAEFGQLPAARQGALVSRSKKRVLQAVDEGKVSGVSKFMKVMALQPLDWKAKATLPNTTPLNDRIVAMVMELNAKHGNPENILFRKCYADYYGNYVLPAVRKGRNVFVGGARGIGKSVFTDILVFLLLEEGFVIVLEHFEQRLLLLGQNPNKDAFAKAKEVVEVNGYDSDVICASEVYQIPLNDADLFIGLAMAEHLVLIQDLGSIQGHTVSFDGGSTKIWISPPNSEKLRPIKKDGSLEILCLPPPDLDELLAIRERWNPNGYSKEEVSDHYKQYGGSVRLVIEYPADRAEQDVEIDIFSSSRQALSEAFSSTLLNLPKGPLTDTLLHPIPYVNNPRIFRLRFASDAICKRLFERMVSVEERRARTFLELVRNEPGLAAFAGNVLEDNLHDLMLKRVSVKVKPLGPAGIHGTRSVEVPALKLKQMFESKEFSDVIQDNLVANSYFRPSIPNFPTIDAFAILPLSSFVPEGEGLCLVTFQSTAVSKKHKTEGLYLERLFNVVKQVPGLENIRRFHVFWTNAEGISTMQKVAMEKPDGGIYEKGREPNVEQWAMVFGDELEELFKKVEEMNASLV